MAMSNYKGKEIEPTPRPAATGGGEVGEGKASQLLLKPRPRETMVAPGQVETYSGYRLHERPRRFFWREEWLAVRRVLARWQEPEALHFKVRATDGRVYQLTYHQVTDGWEVRLWSGKKP